MLGVAIYAGVNIPSVVDVPIGQLTLRSLAKALAGLAAIGFVIHWAFWSKQKLYALWGFVGFG